MSRSWIVIGVVVVGVLMVALWAPWSSETDPESSVSPPGQVEALEAPATAEPDATHPPEEAPARNGAMDETARQQAEATADAGAMQQGSAAEIEVWEDRLASHLAAQRFAEQGDLLTPELVAYLQRRTQEVLEAPGGDEALAAVREAGPTRDDDAQVPLLAVNATYPEDEPLTSVPPALLAAYPALPEGIEYRFVGCRLILLARDAALILDYTEECLL